MEVSAVRPFLLSCEEQFLFLSSRGVPMQSGRRGDLIVGGIPGRLLRPSAEGLAMTL
jgi:hypothetical protein